MRCRSILLVAFVMLTPAVTSSSQSIDLSHGIELYETGELEEAGKVFRTVLKSQPGHGEAAFYLGRVLQADHNYSDAVEWLSKAVDTDGKNARYYTALGEALGSLTDEVSMLRKMSVSNRSKAALQKAVSLDPELLEARENLMQFYLQAPGIAGGSVDKAFDQAEAIKIRNAAAGHRAFGAIYENQEKNELALAEYKQLAASGQANRDDRFKLGIFFARAKDYASAFSLYEKMIEDDAEDIMAIYMIGRLAASSGQNLQRGIESLEIYLAAPPADDRPSLAWASYRLGQIYQTQGDKAAARVAYTKTLEYKADHKEAKKALKELG